MPVLFIKEHIFYNLLSAGAGDGTNHKLYRIYVRKYFDETKYAGQKNFNTRVKLKIILRTLCK